MYIHFNDFVKGGLIYVCILTVFGASLINQPTNPNCDNIHVNCLSRCLTLSSLDMYVKKTNMQKDFGGDIASPPVHACNCLLILFPV